MSPATLVTLNMRELDRLKVIQAVVEMGLKPGRAAEQLGLTVRQVERLMARYRESGAAGMASRKRKAPGNRKLDEGVALRALTTIRERYADFGPTLACEKLAERYRPPRSRRDSRSATCRSACLARSSSARCCTSSSQPC